MAYLPLSFSSDIPTTAFMHVNNCGTLLLTDQDYIIDRPDGRSDYLLLYIARGIGYITIANEEYTVYEKQAFIFHPYEHQRYRFEKKDNTVNYWVHFNGTQCTPIIKALRLNSINILRLNIDTLDIEQMLYRLCHEYTRQEPCYEQICSGLLISILGLISRSIFHSEIKQRKEKNELIEQIISEFYTSMQNPVIINELAKKFSISTNYLIREFKKSTGKTPAQYAIDMRIKKAEELLLFSNYTNAQISEFLGFSNYSYFSRLFKKHTGVTPNDYRAHKNM